MRYEQRRERSLVPRDKRPHLVGHIEQLRLTLGFDLQLAHSPFSFERICQREELFGSKRLGARRGVAADSRECLGRLLARR